MKTNTSCVLVRKAFVDETLAAPSTPGKKLLEPLKALAAAKKLPFNILEDTDISNDAEVHMHEADLWLCLEGEVVFTYGGELIDPWFKVNPDGTEDKREIKAKQIKGGTESVLKPGDWLWIPAGEPHSHSCKGTARLAIIKIPNQA